MNEPQSECWERFYKEQRRPWRGIGKVGDLDIPSGSKVLDVGCGNGKTVGALLEMGMDVTGLDFSPSAIDQCVRAFGGKAKFTIAECERMPFSDETFYAITAVHVLEHLDAIQLSDTVSEIRRVLKPGGVVFVRSFAIGDSRAEGKESDVRGNGISYRYYTVENMLEIFDGFECLNSERVDESMRFGAVRVKVECLFRKHKD